MNVCPICGTKHPESPNEECKGPLIVKQLSEIFEKILADCDTPELRLTICNYTLGYMGAQYGLHIRR